MKTIVLVLGIVVILGLGAFWLYARPAPAGPQAAAQPTPPVRIPEQQAQTSSETGNIPSPKALATTTPTIGAMNAMPTMVTLNMPTPVIITAKITDPSLIPGSVNLLRIGATGTQPTILGVMHDDGQNGDAVAGDGVYTLQVLFNEAAPGQIQLQVSAAFRGLLRRVVANVPPIQISQPQSFKSADIGITMNYPAGWLTQQSTYSATFSNVQDPSTTGDSAFFEVHYIPQSNPGGLSINQWFAQFSQHLPEPPISVNNISIAGHAGVIITVPEVGADTVIYLSRGADIIEITYDTETQQFVGDYAAMLNSIAF